MTSKLTPSKFATVGDVQIAFFHEANPEAKYLADAGFFPGDKVVIDFPQPGTITIRKEQLP